MNASHFVLSALTQEGIDHLFLVPGSLINSFLHAFDDVPGMKAVVAAHETGAAFMADGYARASGRLGVCLVIGGPGMANAVPALAAAKADGSPVLLLSGEVPTNWEGQGAFQDASPAGLDTLAMARPVTVDAQQVQLATLVEYHLHRALRAMLGFTKKPACIAFPRQIHDEEIPKSYRPIGACDAPPPRMLDRSKLHSVIDKIARTRHIVILAGNGVVASGAGKALAALSSQYSIPIATTLRAKGVVPEDHPCSLGVFGYAGTRHAAETLLGKKASVLLVLGSSLNQRNTMMWNSKLRPLCRSIQVDIDPAAIGRHFPVDSSITGDIGEFLRLISTDKLLSKALSNTTEARQEWLKDIHEKPRTYAPDTCRSNNVPMHPARVISALRQSAPRETVVLVDSGAHRAFAGHHWVAFDSREYLSSTTIAPMGWAIAASIGAKLARPDRPCLVVTGDGCMLMHGIEIQTAARYGLAIVFAVINNSAHGAVHLGVRQRPATTEFSRLPQHDWVGFARALGVDGERVETPDMLDAACDRAFAEKRPYLLDLRCDPEAATPITPWTEAKEEWMELHG